MRLEDLKFGNIVELRNGERYVLGVFGVHEFFISLNNGICIEVEKYNNNLIDKIFSTNDIVKVYKNYTLKEVIWKRRKEKPKLTDDEITILKNIKKRFKYIARDEDNNIFLYEEKPRKKDYGWRLDDRDAYFVDFYMFDNLFQFVKWEDNEPYLIEDLLKEQEDE